MSLEQERQQFRKPGIILLIMMILLACVYTLPGNAGTDSLPEAPKDELVFIETELLVAGFNTLSDLKVADDGRFFAAQTGGLIRIGKSDGTILAEPFLDLSDLVEPFSELGLSSIALHPDFLSNGRFFVNYTTSDLVTYIAGYQVSDDNQDIADPASRQEILTVNQNSTIHNGAGMVFGPDGYLYLGLGDGGPGNDPFNTAQDGQQLLGSILRLDVDAAAPYIPDNNPFINDPSVRDEIWAMGLRNPWKMTFDRLNGDLYFGDVGQDSWEEIDYEPAVGPKGNNYGWRCYEGFTPNITSGCGDSSLYTFPIYTLANKDPCTAVVGGYVYRGDVSLPIDGQYLFAEYCSGAIYSLAKNGESWEVKYTGGSPLGYLTSFGEGPNGELYVADLGNIYALDAKVVSIIFDTYTYLPALIED